MNELSTNGQEDKIPPVVNGYKLLRKIGAGSFGTVWLAQNDLTGIYVAIKVVSETSPGGMSPFASELTGLIAYEQLSRCHDAFIPVLGAGRIDRSECFFYVMEIADDANADASKPRDDFHLNPDTYTPLTLKQRLESHRAVGSSPSGRPGLLWQDCHRICKSLTMGVKILHEHGLVHRDIKPSNVLFKRTAPKLADAGLVAKEVEELSLIGTEGYAPPEGTGNKSGDIYALGIVLYEMVTGMDRRAFPSVPDRFETSSPESIELYRIAVKAAAHDPGDRYETALDMENALDLVASVDRLAQLERRVRYARRILLATVLVSSVAFVFIYLLVARSEERRDRVLSNLLVLRGQLRNNGWYTNFSAMLSSVSRGRRSDGIMAHKSSLLAGLDAEPFVLLPGVEASSAAFAVDGRLLFGGGWSTEAHLIEKTGPPKKLAIRGPGLVRFTEDGTPMHLAIATNALELRDPTSGRLLQSYGLGHEILSPRSPVALSFSEDCKLVAAAHGDFLRLWSVDGLKKVETSASGINALAFSPDGLFLAAGFTSGKTRVYSVSDLSETALLSPPGRANPILCLAFGRDPQIEKNEQALGRKWLLATGDQGAAIVIWDVPKQMPRSFCRGSTWIVSSLAFSPDGSLLASAGRNQPRLWDVATGKPLLQMDGLVSGPSVALAFDRTGAHLAIGGLAHGGNATGSLWHLQPDRGIKTLRGLSAPVRKVWFSQLGDRLAALNDDWHVGIWDLKTRNLLCIFETTAGVFADNAGGSFDDSGDQFVFAAGTEAAVFDLRGLRVSRKWQLKSGLFDHVEFGDDSRLFLARIESAVSPNRAVWRLYELSDDADPILRHEQAESYTPAGASLGPRAKWLAAWSSQPDGILRLYEMSTGKEVWSSNYEENADSMRICFDPAGTRFGYTLNGGKLRILELPGFRIIGDTAPGVEAIGPQGRKWCFRFGDGWKVSPQMSESKDGLLLNTDFNRLRWVSRFSRDGNQLAWGTEEGLVLVADLNEVDRRLSQ